MFHVNMKSKNAVMFLSTIVKQFAAMNQSTITPMNAKCAKEWFAIANVNMFQNIIGNMFVETIAAQHLVRPDN